MVCWTTEYRVGVGTGAVILTSWSRSRVKMERLHNTGCAEKIVNLWNNSTLLHTASMYCTGTKCREYVLVFAFLSLFKKTWEHSIRWYFLCFVNVKYVCLKLVGGRVAIPPTAHNCCCCQEIPCDQSPHPYTLLGLTLSIKYVELFE